MADTLALIGPMLALSPDSDLLAFTDQAALAPVSRPWQGWMLGPFGVTSGLMHRSKLHRYSRVHPPDVWQPTPAYWPHQAKHVIGSNLELHSKAA
jgi:hypothetical protein